MNKDELLKAAEVMRRAAQEEVVVTRTGNTGGWIVVNPVWDWCKNDYRILSFPEPPKGESWHNPANLTATQVGVHEGWRLLLDCELDGRERTDVESNFDRAAAWSSLGTSFYPSKDMTVTMRTKSPLPKAVSGYNYVSEKERLFREWMARGTDDEKYARLNFEAGWLAREKHQMNQNDRP